MCPGSLLFASKSPVWCLKHSRCSIDILSKFIHLIIKVYLHRHNWFRGLPKRLTGKQHAYNVGDAGSIPGSGRPLEKDMAAHSSTLAWEILWTEELVGYSPWGHKESGLTEWLNNKNKVEASEACLSNHIAWPEVQCSQRVGFSLKNRMCLIRPHLRTRTVLCPQIRRWPGPPVKSGQVAAREEPRDLRQVPRPCYLVPRWSELKETGKRPWGTGWRGRWEGGSGCGHRYTQGWFMSVHGRTHYNIVK